MKACLGVLLALLGLGGCAAPGRSGDGILALRDACLWGGGSAEEDAQCAEQRWGTRGYLMALNARAMLDLPTYDGSSPCQDHVARLEEALKQRPDLKSSPLFSCPPNDRENRCHLSLLVTDAAGRQYVVDNGAVLSRSRASGGVSELATFARLTGEYRIVARASEVAPPEDLAMAETP